MLGITPNRPGAAATLSGIRAIAPALGGLAVKHDAYYLPRLFREYLSSRGREPGPEGADALKRGDVAGDVRRRGIHPASAWRRELAVSGVAEILSGAGRSLWGRCLGL
jgi:hypothetical protein